jgi:hypothetical protein
MKVPPKSQKSMQHQQAGRYNPLKGNNDIIGQKQNLPWWTPHHWIAANPRNWQQSKQKFERQVKTKFGYVHLIKSTARRAMRARIASRRWGGHGEGHAYNEEPRQTENPSTS